MRCSPIIAFLIGVAVVCAPSIQAQDTTKTISVLVSAGVSQSTVQRTVDVARAEFTRSGHSLFARALWRPGHLLGIGVEAASTSVSRMTVKQDSVIGSGTEMNLHALPLMAVFAMQWRGMEASASVGAASYGFEGSADGVTTESSEWEIAWSAGVRYFLPLSSAFHLGFGGRVLVIPERRVNAYTGDVCLQWNWHYAE